MPYNEEGNQTYDIKRLWGRHKEMLRLHASGLFTIKEIAEELGVSKQTVSHIINSELGKQQLAILEGAADSDAVDLMVSVRSFAPVALAIQQEIALDEDGTTKELRNKICDKFVDRVVGTPMSKNINLNVSAGLKKEDLDEIKQRAMEIKNLTKVEEDE